MDRGKKDGLQKIERKSQFSRTLCRYDMMSVPPLPPPSSNHILITPQEKNPYVKPTFNVGRSAPGVAKSLFSDSVDLLGPRKAIVSPTTFVGYFMLVGHACLLFIKYDGIFDQQR